MFVNQFFYKTAKIKIYFIYFIVMLWQDISVVGDKMMKKVYLTALMAVCALLPITEAYGKKITYLEEMFVLGTVAGQGLACKSKKYHQFELLARASVVGKDENKEMQKAGIEQYNSGKADAFIATEEKNFADCAEVLSAFEKQPIFKSVLYSDGRVKLPDGTMIKPRKSYNASKLYQKDREAFIKADKAYKKSLAEAKKNAQNGKKVPLYDANYNRMAKEFGNQ